MNIISAICVARYEDKAIFIDDENELYFVQDENEVIEFGSTVEDEALISVDEFSSEEIEKIILLVESL